MNIIDMSFTSLKQQIERLKIAVDRCDIVSTYIHTFKIGSMMKNIEPINLTENQKKVFNKLDGDTLKQFERLSKARCSCGI